MSKRTDQGIAFSTRHYILTSKKIHLSAQEYRSEVRKFWLCELGIPLAVISFLVLIGYFIFSGPSKITIDKMAQIQVAELLKDPYSARFNNVRIIDKVRVCGEVDGKNSFGAYSGLRKFYWSAAGYMAIEGEDPMGAIDVFCH